MRRELREGGTLPAMASLCIHFVFRAINFFPDGVKVRLVPGPRWLLRDGPGLRWL